MVISSARFSFRLEDCTMKVCVFSLADIVNVLPNFNPEMFCMLVKEGYGMHN